MPYLSDRDDSSETIDKFYEFFGDYITEADIDRDVIHVYISNTSGSNWLHIPPNWGLRGIKFYKRPHQRAAWELIRETKPCY